MPYLPSRFLSIVTVALGVVVFATACGKDDNEASQASTPPPAAADVVSPTGAPRATATRRVPTPPRPTVTPTPRASLSFRFGRGVDAGDRAIITNVAEAARKVLQAAGAIEAPTTVLAFDTLTDLSQAYRQVAGDQAWRAADVVRRLQSGVAEAGYRNVSIYTSGGFWRDANAVQRAQAVAHEYVHVVQLELLGERLADQTFSTPTNAVPPGGPFWLLEGSAELLSWAIIEDVRLGNLASKLEEYGRRAAEEDLALQAMETYVGYVAGGPAGVATSVLGVSALLKDRPAADLFRFWALVRTGQAWQNAFVAVFGVPIADFYASFETGR